jgi:uncharacterized damage-inducible protein DinB
MTEATAEKLSAVLAGDLAHLLDSSMKKIRNCLEQIDDEQVWWRPQAPMNSIGNLMLHLAGNLRQWGIVSVLEQPDKRERESEFEARTGLTRDELLSTLTGTVTEAQGVMRGLSPDDFLANRTIQGFDVTVLEALGHTVTHFTGHTHQIIMLTRMMLGDSYQYDWDPGQPRTGVPA